MSSLVGNNWNFKGYGLSVNKSLLHKKAVALVFRMPLTMNLDWFERRPYLPMVTSSAAIVHPTSMTSLACHASIPVSLLRWIFWTTLDQFRFAISSIWILLVKLLFYQLLLLLRTILYSPFQLLHLLFLQKRNHNHNHNHNHNKEEKKHKHKQKLNAFALFPSWPHRRPFVTSTDITERIGLSFSWRHSPKYGYEYTITPWHLYLPTLEYTNTIFTQLFSNPLFSNALQDWLRRYTASIGLLWGSPVIDPPFYSAILMFSLSGFYINNHFWKKQPPSPQQNQQQQQQPQPSLLSSSSSSKKHKHKHSQHPQQRDSSILTSATDTTTNDINDAQNNNNNNNNNKDDEDELIQQKEEEENNSFQKSRNENNDDDDMITMQPKKSVF